MGLKVLIFLIIISILIEIIVAVISNKKNKNKESELKSRCICKVYATCVDRYKVDYGPDGHKLPDYFVIWQF